MAEPMHALAPATARRPAARKPRIPHPHLAPAPPAPATEPTPQAAVPLPRPRPAGPPRRRSRPTPAERSLRNALLFGFAVNVTALLIPSWHYGGEDFLLGAAVLLSGQALLMLGRRA